jgi:hypothetical protein
MIPSLIVNTTNQKSKIKIAGDFSQKGGDCTQNELSYRHTDMRKFPTFCQHNYFYDHYDFLII